MPEFTAWSAPYAMGKIAPEGNPFVLTFAAVSACALIFGGAWIALLPLLLTLFMVYFFRDPERTVPADEEIFVAPADGRVILIRDVPEERHLGKMMREISIFMSPMNVHVNRAPCAGKVKSVLHNKGRFLAAYRDDASIRNENIEMVMETEFGDILVRQVAGFVARRAVCRKRPGEELQRGQRYGIIKFSSRVDVYLPTDAEIKVQLDDRVKAGETVIARVLRGRADPGKGSE